ncbi:redoxin domain-containing protein [Planctomycetota bacterium]
MSRYYMTLTVLVGMLWGVSAGAAEHRMSARDRSSAVSIRGMEEQIEQLKVDHAALMKELQALRKLLESGRKDEARTRLDALMKTRSEANAQQVETLEIQVARLKAFVSQQRAQATPNPVGTKATLFELKTFAGDTVKLSDYQGKIVVLEWLSFRCPFTRHHYKKNSTMISLANKYKGKDVVWLAIDSSATTSLEEYQRFQKDIGAKQIPYPILDDHTGIVGRRYGVKTTPQIFIVDKGGDIVYSGDVDNAPRGKIMDKNGTYRGHVDRALGELLDGKAISLSQTPTFGEAVPYATGQ